MSQLTLALDADISIRHLSCVETGRAQPSLEMVLRLAKALGDPLRERAKLTFPLMSSTCLTVPTWTRYSPFTERLTLFLTTRAEGLWR